MQKYLQLYKEDEKQGEKSIKDLILIEKIKKIKDIKGKRGYLGSDQYLPKMQIKNQ